MTPFDVCVYYIPSPKEIETGEKPTILRRDTVLARDADAARIKAAKDVDESYHDRPGRLEVAVRPFCG